MRSTQKKKKKSNFYGTLCTVLTTLLIVAIIWVISLIFSTVGKKTYSVTYSAGEGEFVGTVPATRKFEPGDEVVVRLGDISASDKEMVGWRDLDGVIDYIDEILPVGTVFIMPEADVTLEVAWDDDVPKKTEANDNDSDDEKSDSNAEIYYKQASKDYINVRDKHGYDSEVIAKISDGNTKIEYTGKYEEVYDEDEEKSYDWYFVKIPSKDIEGWIRSDLLTKSKSTESSDKKTETEDNSGSGEKYLKSHKYDVALMREEPDSYSEVVEKIEDDETILYFNNLSEDVVDDDGDTVTWYHIKNSDSGKSGWVEAKRLQRVKN